MTATAVTPLDRRLEQVPIEAVVVGDYLCTEGAPDRPALAACVVRKTAGRAGAGRLTGWHVELAGGAALFVPRGARVVRRRFGVAR